MNRRIPPGKITDTLLTFCAALVVRTGREVVFDHGVANHQTNVRGNGYELELQRAAIEQDRMLRLPHARDELVHDADARADKFVFRAAAEFCNLGQGKPMRAQAQEREGGSDFDRGG